jgi:hypothetical protein
MRALLLVAALLGGGCSGSAERDVGGSSKPTPPTPPATPTTPTTVMKHTDPSDPKAWEEAQAIAAAQGVGEVSKRSDALPFMFQAERVLRAVLIHNGSVVKMRGPAPAGAYLRDLGVMQGKGPQIGDVLWALWALEALPDVKPLPEEGYINSPDSARLKDLNPRLGYDGTSARVVLHYFKPEKKDPPGAPERPGGAAGGPGGPGGSQLKGVVMPKVRPIVRATLAIPQAGDAAWKLEDLNWADPG